MIGEWITEYWNSCPVTNYPAVNKKRVMKITQERNNKCYTETFWWQEKYYHEQSLDITKYFSGPT